MHIAIAFIVAFVGYQLVVALNEGPAAGYVLALLGRAFIVAVGAAAACAGVLAGWDYLFAGIAAVRS